VWIKFYAAEGFGYRQIAAMLYGLREDQITDGERDHVGVLAREMGAGVNKYRTIRSPLARERVQDLHADHRSQHPVSFTQVIKHIRRTDEIRRRKLA
jgi:hypothetical protein